MERKEWMHVPESTKELDAHNKCRKEHPEKEGPVVIEDLHEWIQPDLVKAD